MEAVTGISPPAAGVMCPTAVVIMSLVSGTHFSLGSFPLKVARHKERICQTFCFQQLHRKGACTKDLTKALSNILNEV
jgi:hypothetical protein